MVTGIVAAVARAPPPAKTTTTTTTTTTTGYHPRLGCRWIPGIGAMPAGELDAWRSSGHRPVDRSATRTPAR
jgi:hypothetical protein